MLRYILPGLVWLSVLLLLSFTPGNELQSVEWEYFEFDKLAHISVFALLTHIWLTGFKRQRSYPFLRNNSYSVVIGSTIIIGVLIEIIQWKFISGRVFDALDIVADVIGIVLGTLAFYFLYRNYY